LNHKLAVLSDSYFLTLPPQKWFKDSFSPLKGGWKIVGNGKTSPASRRRLRMLIPVRLAEADESEIKKQAICRPGITLIARHESWEVNNGKNCKRLK